MKDMTRKILAATLASLVAVSLTGCGGEKQLKLEGIEEFTQLGEQTVKATEGLNDLVAYVTKRVSAGDALKDVTIDDVNENLRVTSAVMGFEQPRDYGGLTNMLSLVTGTSMTASSSTEAGDCMLVNMTVNNGKLEVKRGINSDPYCIASDSLGPVTWSTPGDDKWPETSMIVPPTKEQWVGYADRHPEFNIIFDNSDPNAKPNSAPSVPSTPQVTPAGEDKAPGK